VSTSIPVPLLAIQEDLLRGESNGKQKGVFLGENETKRL